jgi:hypothetical protein
MTFNAASSVTDFVEYKSIAIKFVHFSPTRDIPAEISPHRATANSNFEILEWIEGLFLTLQLWAVICNGEKRLIGNLVTSADIQFIQIR